jgi:butyrate kinase
LVSLAGTNDMRILAARVEAGDAEATLIYQAFIYNVGKAIGALATAAEGKVDGIILTGGIAHGQLIQEGLRRMCGWIAPLTIYPGEGELEALAHAGVRALSGEEPAKEYC